MADHLKFERFFWFDSQVRAQRYPNAPALAAKFETCARTAKRAIDFMRDRLGAPLEYDSSRRGYFYTDTSFALPAFQVAQNELLALLLARTLLADSAGGIIGQDIQDFGRKLLAGIGHFGLDQPTIDTGFSAVWHGYTPAEGETFRRAAQALIEQRRLTFRYFSPASHRTTNRLTEPVHLQHYMGSWVLLAWCTDRRDYRRFYLGRMQQAHITETTFDPHPRSAWQHRLKGAFGIFQNEFRQQVVLRFNAHRAGWLRHEIWHPDQVMQAQPDGSLVLQLPVCDFREIKLRILQYGADVEVIEPLELREQIREEIGRMVRLYEDG
jgi:predicted DNA-binding transcriptional regulator YafY